VNGLPPQANNTAKCPCMGEKINSIKLQSKLQKKNVEDNLFLHVPNDMIYLIY